jgi:hypothetical protein
MGVGDVGAVSGGAWCSGHTAGVGDCRRADRERERHVLCGRGELERDKGMEPGGDGVGFGDSTRGGSRAGLLYGAGTDGADGMRGDGVGVGDVVAMSGGTGDPGHTAG